MRKQQVKNLQEEIGNLLSMQPQKQSHQDTQEESKHPFESIQFHHVAYTETQSQEDFLDQVDHVLGQQEKKENQPTRRQVMLNFKINQLTENCKNLKANNTALENRIKELEKQRPSSRMKDSNLQNSKGDLTFIQQDFIELEQELAGYKLQLAKYQQKMTAQLDHQQRQLQQLRLEASQAKNLRNYNKDLLRQTSQKDRVITLLEGRNEQLLIELQKQQDERINKKDSLSDRIQAQMENMIDKLLKQLKIQKKNASKQVVQIKRLNNEILQLQNTLKSKNKKIYQLQFSIIKMGKKRQEPTQTNRHFRQKNKFSTKKEYYEQSNQSNREDQLHPYIHHPHNPLYFGKKPQKDQPARVRSNQHNRSYDKNRITAERQMPSGRLGSQQQQSQPGSLRSTGLKKMQTFTLMDLLNKEFKIRQVQKEIIVCRIIDLYSLKIMQQNYENLIPEEIQIYNFNPQQLPLLQARASPMPNKSDRSDVNEEGMLYNMAFILDTLLNQVDVIDSFVENPLDLNIIDYVSQLESKQSRQEKYKFLQELSGNIQTYCLNH